MCSDLWPCLWPSRSEHIPASLSPQLHSWWVPQPVLTIILSKWGLVMQSERKALQSGFTRRESAQEAEQPPMRAAQLGQCPGGSHRQGHGLTLVPLMAAESLECICTSRNHPLFWHTLWAAPKTSGGEKYDRFWEVHTSNKLQLYILDMHTYMYIDIFVIHIWTDVRLFSLKITLQGIGVSLVTLHESTHFGYRESGFIEFSPCFYHVP